MFPQNPLTAPAILLNARNGLILHQTLYAVARLGVADCLDSGWRTAADLARELRVNEDALYRVLRLLSSQGVFEENGDRSFRNTDVSYFLRSDVPGSLRRLFIFWGSDYSYSSLSQMMRTLETGQCAPMLLSGTDSFEKLRRDPEQARIFDDAMTTMSQLSGPAIAAAYDFGAWDSLMDVGGGSGILLSCILRAHPNLRGVLADQEHVLERARERDFLGGDLAPRASMQPCNFFEGIPSGCRAYVMKNIIHDWDDEQSRAILANCRQAVPSNGALLLVELLVGAANIPSLGKFLDIAMLSLTGGRERTEPEYATLLSSAGFRLNRVVPVNSQFCVIEAVPV
ncbi:MAG TPA: methyltransferase [Acidobacteriaceae bacterium]|nr:methyltransferase [Acidobacteriaceae bacterium]